MRRRSSCQPHYPLLLLPPILLTIAVIFLLPPYLPLTQNLTRMDTILMRDLHVRRTHRADRNTSCTLIACHTRGLPGVEPFWRYYTASPYHVAMYNYTKLHIASHHPATTPVHNQWCCVAAAREENRLHPDTRVVFIDIDTLIDVAEWCNFPMSEDGALVVNSFYRRLPVKPDGMYDVTGTQVQTNAFAVLPGRGGASALQRWDAMYRQVPYDDQGIIHQLERGVCGVPGWIACKNNPEQQRCHCHGGQGQLGEKEKCIYQLFAGKKDECPIKNTSLALAG